MLRGLLLYLIINKMIMSLLDDNIIKQTDLTLFGMPTFDNYSVTKNKYFEMGIYKFYNPYIFPPDVMDEIFKENIPDDKADVWWCKRYDDNNKDKRYIIISWANNSLDKNNYGVNIRVGFYNDQVSEYHKKSHFYDVQSLNFLDFYPNFELAKRKSYELLEFIRTHPKSIKLLKESKFSYNFKDLKNYYK